MGVKTIFKVLLGSMAIMTISFLLIELFNVSVTSYQLRQISKMAARQACVLFTSETYKAGTRHGENVVGGSYGLEDVYDRNGNIYISGDFYNCGSPDVGYAERVWNKIYATQEFVDFCTADTINSDNMNKYFATKALKIAAEAAMNNSDISIPELGWDATPAEIYNQTLYATANMYKQNLYTTANLGIPYMEGNIVDHMYQWNLAQLLSNCDSDSIQPDDNGTICVNFRGFKVYANQSTITDYEYKIYDISPDPNNNDRQQNAIDLWQELNINANVDGAPDYLGWMGVETGLTGHETTIGDTVVYDDWYITSVGIKYNIVVNYEGITPLRNLISWVFSNQVAGLDGGAVQTYTGQPGSSWANVDSAGQTNGGIYGNTQPGLVSSGKLTYVLSR